MNDDDRHERREQLVREVCGVMGWEYRTAPVWAGLRKVALAEAVPVGLDQLGEILGRLRGRGPGGRGRGANVSDL